MEGETVIRVGREILFQAFNWESHNLNWWRHLEDLVEYLAEVGFTSLWLPPSSSSLAPQGYLPKDFYRLDSAYGTENELRSLIQVINSKGLRAMADIVINHRVANKQGAGGHYNRYDGSSMPWDETAITADSGGHGNPSTGDVFGGVPNIDHTQEFVRQDIKKWLQWLLQDVGYSDLRFDYAKGYKADFVKEYIMAAGPCFCVGEYWDTCSYVEDGRQLDYNQDSHRQRIVDWIDGTGGLSAAFDFTTKAVLQEALKRGELWRLRDQQGRPPGVVGMWPSRAVTFLENHDTGSTQAHWPFPPEHVVKGYVYILTHPGLPMVFYDHFYEWGDVVRDAICTFVCLCLNR
ncbi:hypothetical protein KP509_26G011800 [Ceratopteris richardii]|uniref:Alpha-amylase n=1 Tax=Ceratopteris richardii TaxID=49495 RepID=A0A8T2RKS9_CERRI|nr:hypothetical protein KP509_26G011800 [Ceratopteris richardii]